MSNTSAFRVGKVCGLLVFACADMAFAQASPKSSDQADLDESPSLTIGGEVRQKFDANSNPAFGLGPTGSEGFVSTETRLALLADWTPSQTLRAYGEIAHASQWGREPGPRPFDESDLALVEGYVELSSTDDPGTRLKVGRQILALGSMRLSSPRNGVGIKRSFDAVRGTTNLGGTEFDAFYGREVQVGDSVFDGTSGIFGSDEEGPEFWGIYGALAEPSERKPGFDVYYFGLGREVSQFSDVTGDETRHSLNARIHGTLDSFDYDIEGAWQFGEIAQSDIRAWGIGGDVGFTWSDVAWKPRIGLRANYASGDGSPGDGRIETYNPFFPALVYFSFAIELSPSNTTGIRPSLSLRPSDDLTVELSAYATQRSSRNDAVYGPASTPLIDAGDTTGRRVASYANLDVVWAVTDTVEMRGSLVRINAEDSIAGAGGDDVSYGLLWISKKF